MVLAIGNASAHSALSIRQFCLKYQMTVLLIRRTDSMWLLLISNVKISDQRTPNQDIEAIKEQSAQTLKGKANKASQDCLRSRNTAGKNV